MQELGVVMLVSGFGSGVIRGGLNAANQSKSLNNQIDQLKLDISSYTAAAQAQYSSLVNFDEVIQNQIAVGAAELSGQAALLNAQKARFAQSYQELQYYSMILLAIVAIALYLKRYDLLTFRPL
jgi:hypothetical protein